MSTGLANGKRNGPFGWLPRAGHMLVKASETVLRKARTKKGAAGLLCTVTISLIGIIAASGVEFAKDELIPDSHKILVESELNKIRGLSNNISNRIDSMHNNLQDFRETQDDKVLDNLISEASLLLENVKQIQPD